MQAQPALRRGAPFLLHGHAPRFLCHTARLRPGAHAHAHARLARVEPRGFRPAASGRVPSLIATSVALVVGLGNLGKFCTYSLLVAVWVLP